ncbi:transcription antitermination factor NusB [Mangrovicoccus algicola]|uniref:Transcription antitermination protein NusB n=1 Tax=Mangrovicoccus algicola TaxID=2771008 RepID=A0A8J6Z0I3_9RHOB|nr:transcription antitermination factor NusB [Mangrovicoccus algicola]MBE3640324.1 transcription antitermination factor NusB [Mangrovicoccus algicola]
MTGLSGNQKRALRSAARFFAVQALFQMEQSDAPIGQIIKEFADHRFGEEFEDYAMQEADVKVFRTLVNGAVDNQGGIDKMTDRALVAKWPIDRIDPTLRALFRVAGAELTVADTPPRVVIVEYVQITQAFFPDGKESRFVNAVLDHMAREARPEAF